MSSEGSVYATIAMTMNLGVIVDQDATAGGSCAINGW